MGAHRKKRVVEVVPEAGDQGAHRGEAFALAHLRLGAAAGACVAHDQGASDLERARADDDVGDERRAVAADRLELERARLGAPVERVGRQQPLAGRWEDARERKAAQIAAAVSEDHGGRVVRLDDAPVGRDRDDRRSCAIEHGMQARLRRGGPPPQQPTLHEIGDPLREKFGERAPHVVCRDSLGEEVADDPRDSQLRPDRHRQDRAHAVALEERMHQKPAEHRAPRDVVCQLGRGGDRN